LASSHLLRQPPRPRRYRVGDLFDLRLAHRPRRGPRPFDLPVQRPQSRLEAGLPEPGPRPQITAPWLPRRRIEQLVRAIVGVPVLGALHLPERGEAKRKLARALVAALPGAIAKRELEKVEKVLGWSGEQLQIRRLPDAWGPGNILMLEVESEHVTEMFTGSGTKGVTAEAVADDAVRQVRRYLADGVPVGPCLADQLLLPMALAGAGSFRTQAPTQHMTTNVEVIRQFLPVKMTVDAAARRCHLVEVSNE
jgi:RNA 3'-terminal phosphate cyclase